MKVFSVMIFPLSTVFIVSHMFGYVVPSFSLNLVEFFFPCERFLLCRGRGEVKLVEGQRRGKREKEGGEKRERERERERRG